MNALTYNLPGDLAQNVKATLEDWEKNNKVKRLWARDASLWSNKDEGNWLGWLGIVEEQIAHNSDLKKIAEEIHNGGFTLPFWLSYMAG